MRDTGDTKWIISCLLFFCSAAEEENPKSVVFFFFGPGSGEVSLFEDIKADNRRFEQDLTGGKKTLKFALDQRIIYQKAP